jgi:hypothetical protein
MVPVAIRNGNMGMESLNIWVFKIFTVQNTLFKLEAGGLRLEAF